jgi:uncharacterized membrane protein YraQ (UPF0718 family)/copper chaperone CopZ
MLQAMWGISLELAPWLLLGTAVAGVLHVALPAGFVHRQLGGRLGVAKAVALGVPLPLCSCGVIPAGLGLRKDGASTGATVGFLISTPQTGVDSILVSASFLGWPFAFFKLITAAVTGLVGGWIADATEDGEATVAADASAAAADADRPRDPREALAHAFEVLRSIWRWIVFGVVASAAIETLVPDGFFASLADRGTLLPMLACLAVSLPLYVCATASVPIAASLVATGLPGGAALVFLMAGPATNVATIGAIYRALGRRALTVYLSTIIGGSLLSGWLFDSVLAADAVVTTHVHGEQKWWAVASTVALFAAIGWFAIEDLRRFSMRFGGASAGPRLEVAVAGMTCDNCVSRLEKALRALDGVTSATVILEPGRAIVSGSIPEAVVLATVEGEGFTALGL